MKKILEDLNYKTLRQYKNNYLLPYLNNRKSIYIHLAE